MPLLGTPAPSNGEAVTLTSSNPSLLSLTLNPATTGTRSVTLNYAAGLTYAPGYPSPAVSTWLLWPVPELRRLQPPLRATLRPLSRSL